MGEVYILGIDLAGNLHGSDTDDCHYVYMTKNNDLSNFQIPEKCKMCEYYYIFKCCAEQCIKKE